VAQSQLSQGDAYCDPDTYLHDKWFTPRHANYRAKNLWQCALVCVGLGCASGEILRVHVVARIL